ncbi:PASTA domain-containing protein [Streptomyces sp. NPDC102274]|uniref:PASTA domain-containing protein n=1 Tax=Streptomyces sp. NPDC102274 TaxID=3366151 RepID=UPI0037F3BB95
MRTRTAIAAALLLASLTACGATSAPDKPIADDAPATEPATETPATKPEAETPAETASETATLPDLTGQTLQAAQDAAQAAGFYVLTSSDALGTGRMQVLDRNWTVCSQTPAAGEHPADTSIDFGTVKLEETCP